MKSFDNMRRLIEMPYSKHLSNRPGRGGKVEGNGKDSPDSRSGFTLIEILILAVLLGIVALTAVPMLSSAGTIQLRAAANMIAADLEYAKSMAISKGQNYSVVFDQNSESYQIKDQGGNVIPHPVKKGFNYIVDFQSDGRLNRVDITGVNFGSTNDVAFDSLGSPDSGGTVTLQAAGTTVTITVEPITGYISIQ
jgi:type II secretion system protein H